MGLSKSNWYRYKNTALGAQHLVAEILSNTQALCSAGKLIVLIKVIEHAVAGE